MARSRGGRPPPPVVFGRFSPGVAVRCGDREGVRCGLRCGHRGPHLVRNARGEPGDRLGVFRFELLPRGVLQRPVSGSGARPAGGVHVGLGVGADAAPVRPDVLDGSVQHHAGPPPAEVACVAAKPGGLPASRRSARGPGVGGPGAGRVHVHPGSVVAEHHDVLAVDRSRNVDVGDPGGLAPRARAARSNRRKRQRPAARATTLHPAPCPAVASGYPAGSILPNRPCVSSTGPAVKNSEPDEPAAASLPNCSAHRPSIAIGRPPGVRSRPWCANVPFGRSWYALIWPLPKFPTRRSPPNRPKPAGAIARPHGAFSRPRVATRPRSAPSMSNTSTNPSPRPATSSSASAFCLAKATKIRPPMFWIPNGANRGGSLRSTKAPGMVTRPKSLSNTSTRALWKSAAYSRSPPVVEAMASPL